MSNNNKKNNHYPALPHGEILSIFEGIWFD
jgi:hypothetical protein